MINKTIAAVIALVLTALIAFGVADIPGNPDMSIFDIAAFATFAMVAMVKIIWPAAQFVIWGDAE